MVKPVNVQEFCGEEALLAWVQQFAPYGIITLNESFAVRSWNHWMELHSGLHAGEVLGKGLFTIFTELNERRLVPHLERALLGESSVLSTALHRYVLPLPSPYRDAGTTHMLQTGRIAPLFADKRVCGVVIVIEDVTQREIQAEVLSRQHRRNELLSWALAHLLKTEQPRKAVRQLFFKIAELLDLDTFLVYLRDPGTGLLSLSEIGGVPIEAEKNFIDCDFPALLPACAREAVVLNSIQERQEPEYAALKRAGMSAAAIIPLLAKDRNFGLLCFATGTRPAMVADESDLIMTIAQYLAIALDRENTNRQLHKAKEQLSEHAHLLEQRVQERTSRLQESISELETFSYTIAHDLRAPVRALTGYCEVLLEDFSEALPEEAEIIVNKLARASNRMDALTRDLLEFNRVSRQDVVLTRVEMESIIEDLDTLRMPAVRQAITVRPPMLAVRAHRGLLQHVFYNLIDNAVKFVRPNTPPKITIFAEVVSRGSPNTRSHHLTFSSTETADQNPGNLTTDAPGQVRIWIADEGIGIPQEAHQKIFGIFERGVTSAMYEGTGIGLAIVARAMQRMGGTCGVESEPGKGSRFWLELPAA